MRAGNLLAPCLPMKFAGRNTITSHKTRPCANRCQYALQAPGAPTLEIFDGRAKWMHKKRAGIDASKSRQVDYLRDEVASRLCDRLFDINRKFPRALDFGANACNVARVLTQITTQSNEVDKRAREAYSGKVEEMICADYSETMLYRDEHEPFNDDIKIIRKVLQSPEHLPFEPESFDLVLSSLSLHWINDLPSVLNQIHSCLKPDAPFIAAMSGGDTLYELRGSLQLAEQNLLGGIGTHISPLADVRDVGNLLGRAGFKLLTVDVDDIVVDYPSVFALMCDLQAMGEANAALRREHGAMSRDVLLATEAIYRELYGEQQDGGPVTIPATFRTIYMIGWKEGAETPQPLKRGTGQVNLADALGDSGKPR